MIAILSVVLGAVVLLLTWLDHQLGKLQQRVAELEGRNAGATRKR